MRRNYYLGSLMLYLLMGIAAFAQTPHPLDFFPHHLGDIWEYWYDENPPGGWYGIRQNKIITDSLGSDGKYYIRTTIFSNFVVDTSRFEVYGNIIAAIPNVLIYKLDADSGDSWIGFRNEIGAIKAEVIDVFEDILFNYYPVTIKVFSYTDSATGLWLGNHYLASYFGLVRTDVEFSAPEYFIRGAIIDSVIYGTVTPIEPKCLSETPEKFYLHQNYPNPFNPKTTIQYELPAAAKIELTVYDLLGKQVATLVNARQPAGNYRVQFDASNLSTGVYLSRLKINQQKVLTRKMLLLK